MDAIVGLNKCQNKPVLTRYLSITSYLQAYYEYRKCLNKSFSYENWALELNFKSKSSLRMMSYGKRNISEKLMESFARKEKLSEKEVQYLVLLSKLQNTENMSLKKIFLDKISELTDFNVNKTEIKNAFEFLSVPDMHLVQMLISFEDFQATVSNIKKVLSLDVTKIKSILKNLEELNLIEEKSFESQSEKIWKSKAKFFSVTGDEHKVAMEAFHTQTLKEASQVLRQDILDKKIKSLFFSLAEADYADLVETIDQFSNKIKTKYANDYIQEKKIYKMNLQLYPVTEKCEKAKA